MLSTEDREREQVSLPTKCNYVGVTAWISGGIVAHCCRLTARRILVLMLIHPGSLCVQFVYSPRVCSLQLPPTAQRRSDWGKVNWRL